MDPEKGMSISITRIFGIVALILWLCSTLPFSVPESLASPKVKISGPQLLPVDEAAQNPAFQEFRGRLLAAVKGKDVNFLKQHLHPEIKYSFGDDHGIKGFLQFWNLEADPVTSRFWTTIEEVVRLGGVFENQEKTTFTAPYVYARFPSSVDPYEYVAVIVGKVKVHAVPDSGSPAVATLNYHIVKLLDDGQSGPWAKVQINPKLRGFVNRKHIRSPIDYRLQFKQEHGVWKMMYFIAGD